MMIILVTGNNYLLMFVGEGVGILSFSKFLILLE